MESTIYIGEVITYQLPPNSTLKIGNTKTTLYTQNNSTDTYTTLSIDTTEWEAGDYSCVLMAGGDCSIQNIIVKDPLAQTSRLTALREQLAEITLVIDARIKGDNKELTINNKTLIREDLSTLISLKNDITKQVNTLTKQLYKADGCFKSSIRLVTR